MAGSRCMARVVSNLSLSISMFCFVPCWLCSQVGSFTSFQANTCQRERESALFLPMYSEVPGLTLIVTDQPASLDYVPVPESLAAVGGGAVIVTAAPEATWTAIGK